MYFIGQTVKLTNGTQGHIVYSDLDVSHVRTATKIEQVATSDINEVISEEAIALEGGEVVEQKVQMLTTRVVRDNGNTTKLQRAIAMYDATKSRQDMIKLFIAELNMTSAGASTYYATCKKRCTQ